jgi:hypothetical protein
MSRCQNIGTVENTLQEVRKIGKGDVRAPESHPRGMFQDKRLISGLKFLPPPQFFLETSIKIRLEPIGIQIIVYTFVKKAKNSVFRH